MKESTPQGSSGAVLNGHVGSKVDSKGHAYDDPAHNPFDTREGAARREAKAAQHVAAAERINKWKSRYYSLDALKGSHRPWVRDLNRSVERANAKRDPLKYPPTLMFTGNLAVDAGATDVELAALPELSNEQIAALKIREAAILASCRQQVNAAGRRLAKGATACAAPDPISLTDLLAQAEEDQCYLVDQLWPVGGRVLLAAQYKSGKSTLVGNVVRVLVDGGLFLGEFGIQPVRKVVLFDTELDTRTLRRWLRDQGITNTDAVMVISLRGAASSFDILDPVVRGEWVQRITGADVVILDCLRPVLDALGLSEDKDAGRLLVAFDELLNEVGAQEGMIVTHMGHQGERARGDSRLLDWPDALWKIIRDGSEDGADRQRFYFSALGRDVALPQGMLAFDAATRHLTYAAGGRKDHAARAAMPELMELVRSEPGRLSKNAAEQRLHDEYGITQKAARDAINAAIKDGAITVTAGPRNSKLLFPSAPDPVGFALPDAPK